MSTADPESILAARERAYAALGVLDPDVVSRLRPGMYPAADGQTLIATWPSSPLGRLAVVHRPASTLIVTNGLSDPWDRALFGADEETLDYELALEISPRVARAADLAGRWPTSLLYWLADMMVLDRKNLSGGVARFGALTYAAFDIYDGLEAYALPDEGHGLLLAPYRADAGAEPVRVASPDGRTIAIIAVRLLLPDEYDWALRNGDDTGARLDTHFGGRHVHPVHDAAYFRPLNRPSAVWDLASSPEPRAGRASVEPSSRAGRISARGEEISYLASRDLASAGRMRDADEDHVHAPVVSKGVEPVVADRVRGAARGDPEAARIDPIVDQRAPHRLRTPPAERQVVIGAAPHVGAADDVERLASHLRPVEALRDAMEIERVARHQRG
ncbi:Hypothetical protein A7982_00805 [Minicystis rosea]|nr:Hypothetical protein A7982_00805 [Minicystis rosea]